MAMSQQTQTRSEPVVELGNLAGMSSAIESEVGEQGLSTALQLATVLQTTLEVEKLIEVFSTEIRKLVPHDSIGYENRAQGIELAFGKAERHSCSYQLVVAAQSLGQLAVTRKRKFNGSETVLLEHLLCSLVYPLRNAILYKHALTAALKDPLTGIYNRTAMNSALIRETELARRHDVDLSLIAMDIDRFKQINDSYGHLAGDYVIKTVADVVTECTRSSDILFRSGGEEFLILLSKTEKQGAMMLAERIRHTIESYEYGYGEHKITVSASLGVSCFSKGDDSETLYEKADSALYCAKAEGRNCVRFVESL